MEDDAAELAKRIMAKVGRINHRIASAVYDYYTMNEFNCIFMFQSELNEKNECYMLDVIGSKFKLKQYEKDWLYNTIYEVVFGYKPQKNDSNKEEQQQNDDYKVDGIILPNQINWTLSDNDKSKFRAFLGKHAPQIYTTTLYGVCGSALMHILAIGRRYKIDLLQMFFDIFNELRFHEYNRTKHQTNVNYIEFKQFIQTAPYFKTLPNNQRNNFNQAMLFYERKFGHPLLFHSWNKINDSYFQFVQYTFALTAALNKLKHVFINGSGCPLQIDFWIIPNEVISVQTKPTVFISADGYMVDDDDDDHGVLDELNAPNSDDNDPQIGKIEKRLNSAKIQYVKEVIHHKEHKHKIANKMVNAIKFICANEYAFKRVVVIIDRRHSSSKLNKFSDILYVFQPLRPYGEIVKDGFCHETLSSMTKQFMLPKLVYENRTNHISVTDELKGRQFTLSFHIYSWSKIQCYFYAMLGCSARFRMRYLYQLWPMMFFEDTNRDGFAKVDREMVEKEFKIPLNDKVFDVWYPIVTGSPLPNKFIEYL